MLDPILSDLRWICKEVTEVAGFGCLFPSGFVASYSLKPCACMYLYCSSRNYMEIRPLGEFPIENLPFDKVPFLSPTNGWVWSWSLLLKGFRPEGSRKTYAMVKLQYASSTEDYGRPSGGNTIFQKANPQIFISLYDDENLWYFNSINLVACQLLRLTVAIKILSFHRKYSCWISPLPSLCRYSWHVHTWSYMTCSTFAISLSLSIYNIYICMFTPTKIKKNHGL